MWKAEAGEIGLLLEFNVMYRKPFDRSVHMLFSFEPFSLSFQPAGNFLTNFVFYICTFFALNANVRLNG